MNNQNVIVHKIVAGDNLYKLAQQYKTTADAILAANPYVDPYRLKIGDEIIIYGGSNGLGGTTLTRKEVELMNNMRTLWEQHSMWTHAIIVSIIDNLADLDAVTARLMRNPVDIGNVFKIYYGEAVANRITNLLLEHLEIGANLVRALKAGDTARADTLNKEWYRNADDMAKAFASINPFYVEQDMREMFYNHLDLVTKTVSNRLARNYEAETKAFDNVEKQALLMADTFTDGIINQFAMYFS